MSKAQVEISPYLYWQPFQPSVDKDPIFSQIFRFQAQSASTTNIVFNFQAPSGGVLLDNEVWLHSQLIIANGGNLRRAFSTANANIFTKNEATDLTYATGLRCGNPIQNACANISTVLNGTNVNVDMSKIHQVFNRLFLSQEEADTVFSTSSGGGFDDGNHSGFFDGFGWDTDSGAETARAGFKIGTGNNNIPVAITSNFLGYSDAAGTGAASITGIAPESQYIQNRGFRKRINYLMHKWRYEGGKNAVDTDNATATTERFPVTWTLHVYEKLAFSPFHMYDNRDIKMSIPNLNTLSFDFQLHSKYREMMFRSALVDPAFTVDFWTNTPELITRWFTPPAGMSLPQRVSIPYTKIWCYINSAGVLKQTVTAGYVVDVKKQIVSNLVVSNIGFPAVPDFWVVYVRRRITDWKIFYPDDYFLSLDSLTVQVEASDQKLGNISVVQLWNLYRKHLRLYPVSRDSFESWYKFHMIIPITAADLGIMKGAGYQNPIQMTFSNMNVNYHHPMPSMGFVSNYTPGAASVPPSFHPEAAGGDISYDFVLMSVYDKYAFTLGNGGTSELELLMISSDGTATAPPASMGPAALADINI